MASEKLSNALQKSTGTSVDRPKHNLRTLLSSEAVQNRMKELLGESSRQFAISILSLSNGVPALLECVPETVFNAALKAAALNLPIDPNLGFAHIIPYNNTKKNVKEAQFQLGAKGFIQLAMRTGQYLKINYSDVRQGELKKYNRLTEEYEIEFIEDDDAREKLPIVGYIGYFKLINGFEKHVYWSMDKLEAHAKRYSAEYRKWGSGNWRDNKEAMCAKTVVKNMLAKWGVLSVDMQKSPLTEALVTDGAIIDNNLEVELYPDNETVDENGVITGQTEA